MIEITRKYHFHAAHRNISLDDKCRNLHGHTYHVKATFIFENTANEGITELFADLDKAVIPLIDLLDHSLLIFNKDPFYIALLSVDEKIKINVFDFETSAENLAMFAFKTISAQNTALHSVSLSETPSSEVVYSPKK